MLENEIRHATICEEVNRAYKQGAGKEFHETFHGFRDRNDAIKMSRSLLGLNLDMFKKMSRIRDFKAARGALVALANQAMMIIIELDSKPIEKDNHGALCKELQELYHRKNLDYGDSFHLSFLEEGLAMPPHSARRQVPALQDAHRRRETARFGRVDPRYAHRFGQLQHHDNYGAGPGDEHWRW